jgi:TRAP-type C4-dicarboxylate transport system substrate-binding protein
MSRMARAARGARRAWPIVLMAWERWQKLPQHEKDRYRRQAQDYAKRGRKLIEERRRNSKRR